MENQTGRERDLILAHNQFAYILDETKGNVQVYTGPYKTSLAASDRPVTYESRTRRFDRCELGQAIQEFPAATEGWYMVLENPSFDKDKEHPTGGSNNLPKLDFGRKINIPGPVTFPLWPGQVSKVIEGHNLRSNQYLVVRVYNEDAAKENWSRSVIKRTSSEQQGEGQQEATPKADELTMGQLNVIKGTDVSFYIPPTGVEVVPEGSTFVREATTLERLEYAILLDEDGNKRFEQGPKVVFPTATEKFVERNGSRKFKAIELNEDMGLYIKVIADYTEGESASATQFSAGQELFITGKNQKIYYPRQEHAIIRYGDKEIHYGIAIPEGEARYVLNKLTGSIDLVKGPQIFLADPRKQVIVRRVLDEKTVQLWFPGNTEAMQHNARLRSLAAGEDDFVTDEKAMLGISRRSSRETVESYAGDEMQRGSRYTPPRTVTIDSKYEGAVSLSIWTGYAIQVVSKTGERRVVIGPQTTLLDYDETLEAMELSTGTPKSDDNLIKTVFLRVAHNKVSDIVTAETGDLVNVSLKLSYRVDFEGETSKWFNVENYVKFLTDHMRSLLRNAVKQHGVAEFNHNAIDIVRDAVLGPAQEIGTKRTGRLFEENGMKIYDVEVLAVSIGDSKIADMLVQAQHAAVKQAILLADKKRELELTQETSAIDEKIIDVKSSLVVKKLETEEQELKKKASLALANIAAEAKESGNRLQAKLDEQKKEDELADQKIAREKRHSDYELDRDTKKQNLALEATVAEVDAFVKRFTAISPDLIAAMQAFGDTQYAEKLATAVAPLAIIESQGLNHVVARLFKDTPVEKLLTAAFAQVNGHPSNRLIE